MPSVAIWCSLMVCLPVITSTVVVGQEYYVTPSLPPSPDCSKFQQCHTLDYYARNSSYFFRNKMNITIILFPGKHSLTATLKSSGTVHFHMRAYDLNEESMIHVLSGIGLSFTNVDSVTLTSVRVVAVREEPIIHLSNVKNFKGQTLYMANCDLFMDIKPSKFAKEVVTHVTTMDTSNYTAQFALSDCEFLNSQLTINLHGQNALMNATLMNTKLKHSAFSLYVENGRVSFSMLNFNFMLGRGIYLNLHRCGDINVYIDSSTFTNCTDGLQITVYEQQSEKREVQMTVVNSVIIHSGTCGLCILAIYTDSILQLLISNSTLAYNQVGLSLQCTFIDMMLTDSILSHNNQSGIYLDTVDIFIMIAESDTVDLTDTKQARVNIINCRIEGNLGTGLYIKSGNKFKVMISGSSISFNKHQYGNLIQSPTLTYRGASAAGLIMICPENSNEVELILTDCSLKQNENLDLKPQIIFVYHCFKTVLKGHNEFSNNNGTSLEAYKSQVVVSGTAIFFQNHAYRGAGLALINSRLHLDNNSYVSFKENKVSDVGGAIYYSSVAEDMNEFCFFELNITDESEAKSLNVTVEFDSNYAQFGGHVIYGAAFDDECSVTSYNQIRRITNSSVYQDIFIYTNNSTTSLSSEPTRVCLCDHNGVPHCTEEAYILSELNNIYPGETITLPVVIIGRALGRTSGSVYTNVITTQKPPASIDSSQQSQKIEVGNCSSLQFTVYSTPKQNVTLLLTVGVASTQTILSASYVNYLISQYNNQNSDEVLTIPVYASMFIDDCPLGFSLSSHLHPVCECADMLKNVGIHNCTIRNHTGFVKRSGSVWVGMINHSGEPELGTHKYCPFRYCKADSIHVNLSDPDSQCSSNRSGILCGKCKPGFSLALGSYNCIECSDNRYVTLIIPILLGTLLLVTLIKVLNFTVANGMINGLIFYANIMWANKSTLLSTDSYNVAIYVVQVPIGWLNLDFGFETCFIQNMDAIGKTWFHFGQDFLYIVAVTSLIIISSRHSTFVTKLLGNNTVPILATIVFLSYTKLLQTIIDTLSFSIISSGNQTYTVWLLDGNVPYFSWQHTLLFVTASVFFSVLWLPYTFFLLFGQCLRKKASFRLLKWMDNQKPYFDAYYGPFKDKYHYWFGILLVARIVFLVLAVVTPASSPQTNLVAVIIVGGCLLTHPYQYKSLICSLLEKIFCLNLITVAAGVLYCDLTGIDQSPVILFSTIFFLCILLLIVCHSGFVMVRKCFKKTTSPYQIMYENTDVPSYEMGKKAATVYSVYREPLLESASNYNKKYLED